MQINGIDLNNDEARYFRAKKIKRGERRKKDYTKAVRKQKIAKAIYGGTVPWYDNLHQYSKNKIHCSCPCCAFNARYHGRALWKELPHSEMLRAESLTDQLKEYKLNEAV